MQSIKVRKVDLKPCRSGKHYQNQHSNRNTKNYIAPVRGGRRGFTLDLFRSFMALFAEFKGFYGNIFRDKDFLLYLLGVFFVRKKVTLDFSVEMSQI